MPQPQLSPQTQDAIDRDLQPHLVGAAGAPTNWVASLGALFQLLAPVLIKILQNFSASGTVPTVANVFQAGHEITCHATTGDPKLPLGPNPTAPA
ncbi:MAG TPA: hypothetical protein VG125_05620 [Pirellulales bacterium]|jgi:hypothetical protein|nr:hypothetical protein [Pirellulales bacterium]